MFPETMPDSLSVLVIWQFSVQTCNCKAKIEKKLRMGLRND
jgi:hypothetical protein